MVCLHSSTASGNISNSNRPFGTCPSNRNPLGFDIRGVPDMSTTFRKHGRLFEKLRGGNGSIVRNQATRKMVTQTVNIVTIELRSPATHSFHSHRQPKLRSQRRQRAPELLGGYRAYGRPPRLFALWFSERNQLKE